MRHMKMMASVGVLAFAACSTVAWAGPPSSAAAGGSVTTIRVNGESSYVNLYDPNTGTQGFAWPTRDQIANTSWLDFSYATPTADPDIITLVQGAGEIPNSAFETTNTTAHLNVVTPFPVIRCEVDLVTGDFSCAETDPVAFDLTWVVNGFETVQEHISRLQTLGPLTVRFAGLFHQRSAAVNGTWTGNIAVDNSGDLFDTGSMTVLREITMRAR